MAAESNYFNKLNAIDISGKVEKKNGFNYLSWVDAWGELKAAYPEANYTVYENDQGFNYHTDGRTAWVKTGVTVNGIEHIEYLPVMDYRNNSIPLDKLTSYDVNKAIQRSITKAIARHGLGLYIYAGEDLPTEPSSSKATTKEAAPVKVNESKEASEAGADMQKRLIELCNDNGIDLKAICKKYKINRNSTADDIASAYYDLNNKLLRGEDPLNG